MKAPAQLWTEAARLAAAGVGFAWVTVVRTAGSTPRHVGAGMMVLEDQILGSIGGGRWEHTVTVAARAALAAGRSRAVRFHLTHELGMCCGGEMEVFIDVVTAPPPLVIFGAGHVALALAPLAHSIGFALWVIDELEEFASEARFPGAQLVHGFDTPSWAQALPLGPRTSVLIATRDHAVDQQLLEALIGRELGWLGVIGSRGKAGRFRRRLEARGVAAERIARVRMPVGLDIGAETPEEIAVSIAAELIQVRHAGQPRSGDGPAEVEVEVEQESEK